MDLHAATRLGGQRWNIAKVLALLCFLVACAILVITLTGSARADMSVSGMPLPRYFW